MRTQAKCRSPSGPLGPVMINSPTDRPRKSLVIPQPYVPQEAGVRGVRPEAVSVVGETTTWRMKGGA